MLTRIGLDFDGVLANSFDLSYDSLQKAFASHGRKVPPAHIVKHHMTSQWDEFYRRIGLRARDGSVHPSWRSIDDAFIVHHEQEPAPQLVPGAEQFLLQLAVRYHSRNIVIITNSHRERIIGAFERAGLDISLVSDIVETDGMKTQALEYAHVDIYVGDTVSDGIAARGASQKPGFVGITHNYAFSTPQQMRKWITSQRSRQMIEAQSLKDAFGAVRYISTMHVE
jgi:phosphoglycolate phosphatase-like HAD superfamily hydrolase